MGNKDNSRKAQGPDQGPGMGPWDRALDQIRQWDPEWAEKSRRMASNPWTNGVLPRKTIELISIALNASCTNLDPDATRHHIRAALQEGATREEILFFIRAASIAAIHSCSLGAPILLEEAKASGLGQGASRKTSVATPTCDELKAIGQWNEAWDPFFKLDPAWTEEFFAMAAALISTSVVTPKTYELLCIAIDASYTHMYVPGLRRHIKAAFRLGATMEEIMEVLKLCVVQGVHACNMGIPILAEELKSSEEASLVGPNDFSRG